MLQGLNFCCKVFSTNNNNKHNNDSRTLREGPPRQRRAASPPRNLPPPRLSSPTLPPLSHSRRHGSLFPPGRGVASHDVQQPALSSVQGDRVHSNPSPILVGFFNVDERGCPNEIRYAAESGRKGTEEDGFLPRNKGGGGPPLCSQRAGVPFSESFSSHDGETCDKSRRGGRHRVLVPEWSLADDFEIISMLDSGGTATVCRARERTSGYWCWLFSR